MESGGVNGGLGPAAAERSPSGAVPGFPRARSASPSGYRFRVPGILEHLYEAVVSDGRWNDFISSVAEALPGSRAALHGAGPVAGDRPSIFYGHFAPEFADSYVRHYHRLDPWMPRRLRFAPGSIYFAEDVMPIAEFAEAPFYSEWLKPQGLGTWLGMSLPGLGLEALFLDIYLPLEVTRHQRKDAYHLMLTLKPHVARALRLNRISRAEVRGPGGTDEQFLRSLNKMPLATAVFDRLQRLIFANPAAESILRQSGGSVGEGLQLEDQLSVNLLRTGLESALSAYTTFGPFRLTLKGKVSLVGVIAALPITAVDGGSEPPYAALFLVQMNATPAVQKRDLIGKILGLTQAELSVVLAIASGKTLSEFAGERGISPNTAKSQLASAFAKTGATRQSDLILILKNNFNW